jgi:catenin alpha
LSAVTRLLILADMIDVHLLLKKLRRVEDDLEYLKSVSSQAELMEGMDRFGKSSADLMTQAAKRQYELKDPVIDFSILSIRVPNSAVQTWSMFWLAIQKVKVNFGELRCKGSSTSTYFYKTVITLGSPLKVLWIRIWIGINITAFSKY